jgi:shikimate kinase
MTDIQADLPNDAEAESLEGNTPSTSEIEEIRQAYLKTIDIPKEKRTPQIVVCPVGLVGSGKTTVMKALSKRLGLVRISTDDIRMMLKERGFNYKKTGEIALGIIEPLLGQSHRLGLDMDCAGSARPFIEKLEKESQIRVVWLHIDTPEPEILKNLSERESRKLFKNSWDAVANYQRRKPLHANLNMPFAYVFKSTRDRLDEQIKTVANLIEQS